MDVTTAPKILLVDDRLPALNTFREALERKGYDVVPATSVDEARRLFGYGNIGLVVADYHLRGSELGIDVVKWMRANGKNQPFVLMSDDSQIAHSFPVGQHEDIQEFWDKKQFPDLLRLVAKYVGPAMGGGIGSLGFS